LLIYFIHSLEVTFVLLLALGFFQIRKHYILYTVPPSQKSRPVQKLKTTKPQTESLPTINLERQTQNKHQPNYYFHKLPQPEVSISSDQDLAFLSKKTPKPILTRTPKPTQATKHKAILNNYIDDFFSVSSPDEFQEPVFQKPIDDEFITVLEDGLVDGQIAEEQIVDEQLAEKYLAQRHTAMYSNSIH